jgi:hypothetical protein
VELRRVLDTAWFNHILFNPDEHTILSQYLSFHEKNSSFALKSAPFWLYKRALICCVTIILNTPMLRHFYAGLWMRDAPIRYHPLDWMHTTCCLVSHIFAFQP